MSETMTELPPGAVLAKTWEECAAHLEQHGDMGGEVWINDPQGRWHRGEDTAGDLRGLSSTPGKGGWFPRALLPPKWRPCADPVELAAAVAAGVEVQCVAVDGRTWETGCEDSESFRRCMANDCRYRLPVSWSWSPEPPGPVTGDDLRERIARAIYEEEHDGPWKNANHPDWVQSLRSADAVLAVLPPQPAPPPVPSWPDGVLRDAANRLRWIANSGYIEDPGIKRIIRSWADELDATPAPPWPGAVLSGLTDEDGVPTWLTQAGQVRGGMVRCSHNLSWAKNNGGHGPGVWVEVRDPRAVPVPETERVPWWEARDRLGLAGDPFVEVGADDEGPWVRVVEGGTKLHSPVAPDGTVEVLARDGDQ